MGMDVSGGDEPLATINVTSLVDVMFCLLIAFMVTSAKVAQEMVEIEIPEAPGETITEEEFLYSVISIDSTGQVFMGTLPLSTDVADMTKEISANQKLKDEGRAFIQGDKNVPYEKIVDVMVALEQAGVREVGFVTEAKKRGG